MAPFNPRIWLRDWLNKPTAEERAKREALLAQLREGERLMRTQLPISAEISARTRELLRSSFPGLPAKPSVDPDAAPDSPQGADR
jgi:hypothetical protein